MGFDLGNYRKLDIKDDYFLGKQTLKLSLKNINFLCNRSIHSIVNRPSLSYEHHIEEFHEGYWPSIKYKNYIYQSMRIPIFFKTEKLLTTGMLN